MNDGDAEVQRARRDRAVADLLESLMLGMAMLGLLCIVGVVALFIFWWTR